MCSLVTHNVKDRTMAPMPQSGCCGGQEAVRLRDPLVRGMRVWVRQGAAWIEKKRGERQGFQRHTQECGATGDALTRNGQWIPKMIKIRGQKEICQNMNSS